MNENFIITIGRQFGSGGREIGRQLSRLMNINYYDKELIQEAAKESGIDPHYFEKADETTPTGLYHAMLGFSSFNYEGALCNENIFKLQADVIQNIARKHSWSLRRLHLTGKPALHFGIHTCRHERPDRPNSEK